MAPGREDPGPTRVLLVDAHEEDRVAAATALEREGVAVEVADTEPGAEAALAHGDVDLVVLDVALGEGLDGFGLLSHLRRASDVPVIVVSERAEEPLRLLGLELGADDYVAKPCSPLELVSRVRAVLRRATREAPSRLLVGDLDLDLTGRRATRGGEPLDLTARELDLLEYLVRHPGEVLDRTRILREVWSSDPEWQGPATVTEHVRRLRAKIEPDPAHPTRITTVRGRGYRWDG